MHTNLQKRFIMLQIIGAGAIGCLNAAHLLRIGQKVCLITRKKPSCQQLLLTTSDNVPFSGKLNSLTPVWVKEYFY
jgi:glycine/D-amino acid oxidase-like deaminating enzyme